MFNETPDLVLKNLTVVVEEFITNDIEIREHQVFLDDGSYVVLIHSL